MKVPKFIKNNLLLKMTSLNAPVIITRLGISLFIQRMISLYFGEAGFHLMGQLRNLIQMLTSLTSLGVFNGIVKYVAEFKEDNETLHKVFSTTFVFWSSAVAVSSVALFFGAGAISEYIFQTTDYTFLIKLTALIVPFIGLQRIFNGVINGLSQYKKFVKIDLISYLASAGLTIYFVYEKNLDGVLLAIAITPLFQFLVLVLIFFKELKRYIPFRRLSFKVPMAKSLLAFSLMSFFATVVLNYLEIEIRNVIVRVIDEKGSGIWTAMTSLSKNYMSFSIMLFSMYVLPKFAVIQTRFDFTKELKNIYKTLLPIFGVGMILVYLLRDFIIDLVFPGHDKSALEPLFKWQLIGDFIRLMAMVVSYQFIAKKLVRTFIFTELLSTGLFFTFAYIFVNIYGVEGVVIGHLLRYIVYFLVVLFLVYRYFKKQKTATPES
ncbi:MAG: O-antigen translocase [Flavobacteriaceae bacterium]|nr:O-antigen translocase [Flavobacteriaceae bacterium]